MIVQLGTQAYKSNSLPLSAQRCVNFYAERQPPDAKTPVSLFGAPGVVSFATAGEGPVRGFVTMGGTLYVVSGGALYSISSTGTATELGVTITGSDVVSMDTNGTQICIVNGVNGYIYSVAGSFQLITDTDFNAANTVRFLDQRFVFDHVDTGQFFASDILDGTSYNALVFATAESRPDNVLAVEVSQQILYVFGERTIEQHQNVGAANFPWERLPGAVIERGLAGRYAIAKEDSTIFFLGDDRVFYRFEGMSIRRVSTHALEQEWRDYTQVSDAIAFGYTWNGHKFIALTFPLANKTYVYDISTQLWHERESWDLNGNSLGRWRANCHISAYGKELIGDAFSGQIGYLSNSTYTEFGNTMRSLVTNPPIHQDRRRIGMSSFEVDLESGVGLTSGQGSDPLIMLDWSNDGGRTYGTQRTGSMGAIGKYRTRARWTRLGQTRNRVMRLSISDPVKRTILAAHADLYTGV
jgi:hypothetical protein